MQLKGYQNEILRDLGEFLDLVGKNQNLNLAWQEFWNLRGYSVDKDSFVKPYKTNLNGVIDICFKVPTGGGKTIIGASSLRVIFDNTPKEKPKFVVWLVPSDTILTQTFENFTNLNHPYAKRLKADFGEVAIYDKEMLLGGENFSETAVQNQLSIAILSMQSIRSKNKDGRKIYEENGALAKFNTNDEKFEETALISVLRKYNPVVVIDESHNAKSDLSVEMLENLNPSFVLELTATPKINSNILSFISAKVLKDESMVKLPVIVRNVSDKNRAISESIGHRNYLENLANKIGEKIRPIVLFQAESKNARNNAEKEEERKTFEKIKEDLVEKFEISKDEIAIKTAEINELKGVNLMSDECKIRYIITINALKEGWDCPFAYILTTLANRSSAVEIEQIVGRILRQPYTKKSAHKHLNASYVFCNSNDFRHTLDSVIAGLNGSGFSDKDCRVVGIKDDNLIDDKNCDEIALNDEPNLFSQNSMPTKDNQNKNLSVSGDYSGKIYHNSDYQSVISSSADDNFDSDEVASVYVGENSYDEIDKEIEFYENDSTKDEIMGKKSIKICDEFMSDMQNLMLPQFVINGARANLMDDKILVEKANLTDNFDLLIKGIDINFEMADYDTRLVDTDEKGAIKLFSFSEDDRRKFLKNLENISSDDGKEREITRKICSLVNKKIDYIKASDIEKYVMRIIDYNKIDDLRERFDFYASKIIEHIEKLIKEHCENEFYKRLDNGKISCEKVYKFRNEILLEKYNNTLPNSLYEYENIDSINDFEFKVIEKIANMDNVKWWHRINSKSKGEFFINGGIGNHYPDFIIMTNKGNIIALETKGDYLDGSDSMAKIKLGRKWADLSGYKYFMLFDKNKIDGAYNKNEFFDMFKDL